MITRLELGGAQQNTLYCTANHDRGLFDVELIAGAGGQLDDEAEASRTGAKNVDTLRDRLIRNLEHTLEARTNIEELKQQKRESQ